MPSRILLRLVLYHLGALSEDKRLFMAPMFSQVGIFLSVGVPVIPIRRILLIRYFDGDLIG